MGGGADDEATLAFALTVLVTDEALTMLADRIAERVLGRLERDARRDHRQHHEG